MAFSNLIHLEILDLQSNSIRNINSQNIFNTNLYGNSSLTYLNLFGNQISENIESITFTKLVNLVFLDLSENPFSFVENNVFTSMVKLKVLRITSTRTNCVASRSFNGLNLEEFDYSGNLIRKMDRREIGKVNSIKITIKNMPVMKEISEYTFSDVKDLQVLEIENNSVLQYIHSKAFVMSTECKMIKLTIKKTSIRNFAVILFQSLVNLVYIDLSGNLITGLHVDIFKNNVKLEYIDLSLNKILILHQNTFAHLTLGSLDLSGLLIDKLGQNHFGYIHTTKLTLCNSSIHRIDSFALENVDGVIELKVCNNVDLSYIDQFAFAKSGSFCPGIQYIGPLLNVSFSGNNLTSIAENIIPWQNVSQIDISGNKLNCSELSWMTKLPLKKDISHEIPCNISLSFIEEQKEESNSTGKFFLIAFICLSIAVSARIGCYLFHKRCNRFGFS